MWWLGQQLSPQAGLLDVVGMTFLTIARAEYCFNAALDQAALYLHVHGLLQGVSATSVACRRRSQAPFFRIPTTPDESFHVHAEATSVLCWRVEFAARARL
ncbi:hypothetical protein HBI55_064870 [Parastagonospora nodorum]|nr:hypothetical protein HBI77_171970 [Parastagonospora nodorum]KAH5091337.1 hypothetical protein HBH72_204460 [Parastagonospora nodorum]KAH5518940.1 hypothetical protein HBI52_090410 [Parastagonospora nodorum]KAH5986976.1 hypothetical protein HBI84_207330 [Parastagonospora nodorum]KAH6499246.1 hypothetical protein HBI55_064870 [Parastagonospora nodorum]